MPTRCRRWPRGDDAHGAGGAARLRAACCCARSGLLPELTAVTLTLQPVQRRRPLRAAARGRRGRAAAATSGAARQRAGRRCRRRCDARQRARALRRPARAGAAGAARRRCARCFTIIWAQRHLRTRQVMAGRADAWPTPAHPTDEPARRPRAPTHRHGTHRAVGQRQQGGAAAQHAAPGHPQRRARRHAVPAGRRRRHHRAPAARRAPHPRRTTCTSWPRCCSDWPQAEYNIEGNPFHNLMDFVRAACGPHQVHLRARQRRPVHLRPRLGPCRRRASACAPLIAEAQALGVRVSLFMDPLPEAMARGARSRRRPRRALHRALCRAPTARRGRRALLARFAAAAAGRAGRRAWASTPATT